MPCYEPESDIETRHYPSSHSLGLRIAGFILIGIGVLLILFCVPYWAWLAVIGVLLILLGLLLIKK